MGKMILCFKPLTPYPTGALFEFSHDIYLILLHQLIISFVLLRR